MGGIQKDKVNNRFSSKYQFRNSLWITFGVFVLTIGIILLIVPVSFALHFDGLTPGTILVMLSIMKIYKRFPMTTLYALRNLPLGKKCRNVLSSSLVAENPGILFQLLFRYLAWMLPIAFYSMLITAVLIQSVREFSLQNVALLLAVCYCIFAFSGNHFLYYSDGERGVATTSGN